MDDSTDAALDIQAPISLLPDLSLLGIDEVDKGVCEDTPENRRALRAANFRYQPVIRSDGSITTLIQAYTPESRAAAFAANKGYLLTDTRNIDSDYITGMRLLMDPSAQESVPAWVTAGTKEWMRVKDEREREGGNRTYRAHLIGPPSRCSANRIDGHRCANWTNGTATYGDFCRMHQANRAGGEDENRPHSLAAARNRLESARFAAVDKLEELLDATSEAIALGAARDILDRTGLRTGTEVDTKVTIEMRPASEIVQERLDRLRAGAIEKAKIAALQPEEEPEPELDEIVIEVEDD